jgi:hypothetical protein
MFCVLCVVLSGCAGLAHQFPASSPSVASGADPALDAQTKLLESAYRAFVQERYPLAAVLFQRFVDSNPNSPRLSEVRWWLARSNEERGDLPAALSVYRTVVVAAPPSVPLAGTYAFHALNRLDTFRRSFGSTSLLERRQVALWLSNLDWLMASDAGVWIAQLADAGVTSLILEAGASGPMGIFGQTTKAPVVADRFKTIVPVAHAKGMAVLASLNLHEPDWMAVSPERRTVIANGISQQAGSIDILQLDYQRAVGEVVQDLLRTDIDGLVVGARRARGFAEEWSPMSRRQFEGMFGPSLDSLDQPVSPDAWRWAGWKTRTYLGFLAQLTRQLRQTRPGFVTAVAVHEQAVLSPAEALTDYGEDLLETKQRGLHVIVQPEPISPERSNEPGAGMERVRQRLALTFGDERQLWMGMALGASDPASLVAAVQASIAATVGQAGPHLLLMNGPAIP